MSAGEDDDEAFRRLVSTNTDRLLRTAYLLCGDTYEAEDLLQETWARVAARWQRVVRMDQPAAYARRILVNHAIDTQAARARRRQEIGSVVPPRDVVDGGAGSVFTQVDSQD